MNTALSDAQFRKARATIRDLQVKRRMFLSDKNTLDKDVFREALLIDKEIRDIYRQAQLNAMDFILKAEERLLVNHPTLGKNQRIVDCNLYTGGLDIVSVLNAKDFTGLTPNDRDTLYEELFLLKYGPRDNIPPRELPHKESSAQLLTDEIWNELKEFPFPDSCILLLHTRFHATWETGLPAIRERLGDLIRLPAALAYLIYRNERVNPLIDWGTCVVIPPRTDVHFYVNHWKDELSFGKRTEGFDYKVLTAFLI